MIFASRIAAFALLSVLFATQASAVTHTTLQSGGDNAALTASTVYNNGSTAGPPAGLFFDDYNFFNNQLTGPATFSLTATGGAGIGGLTYTFLQGSTVIDTITVTNGTTGLYLNPLATLSVSLLQGITNYALQVTGVILSSPNGLGVGNYTFLASTTPLPPALLLFGSALACLGWLGRRARQPTGV